MLNIFFDVAENQKIGQYEDPATDTGNIGDQLLKATSKYKNHSIVSG